MPKLRLRRRSRRGGPWLAVGIAAAVVALPGVASADPLTDPVTVGSSGTAPDPAGAVLDQVTGQTQQGDQQTQTQTQTQSSAPQQQATQQDATAQDSPAPPSLPPQLQQLLAQLQSKSPNPECSAAIQKDLTTLLTDVPALVTSIVNDLLDQLSSPSPPSQQQILDQLTGLLGQLQGKQQSAAAAGPSPDPTVILTDLQQLVTDLTTKCLTPPPTTQPPTSNPPPSNPQPPAQPVTEQQAAAPVSYPGYAPTGSLATTALRPAGDQVPSDPVPLSVLGGLLLTSTAAAVALRSGARRGGR